MASSVRLHQASPQSPKVGQAGPARRKHSTTPGAKRQREAERTTEGGGAGTRPPAPAPPAPGRGRRGGCSPREQPRGAACRFSVELLRPGGWPRPRSSGANSGGDWGEAGALGLPALQGHRGSVKLVGREAEPLPSPLSSLLFPWTWHPPPWTGVPPGHVKSSTSPNAPVLVTKHMPTT